MLKNTILIIILIIVIAGVGYWIYRSNSTPEEAKENEQIVQDETIDWNVYTNEKYGYEIKYPKDWKVQKPSEPPYPGPPEGVEFSSLDTNNFCRMAVEASTFSFAGEIESLRSKEYSESTIKVGGTDAIQLTTSQSNATPIFIYFEYKNNFYRINRGRGTTTEIDQKCIDVFDKMISSLKFSETAKSPLEQACFGSGGETGEILCCKSNSDFPNMCLIGACGCSPNDSHYVKICNCGYGKCFNGETCVSQ